MRADRLLSILMFLQTRGRTTTERLALEFEVSRRTVIRDLYALRVAGFPIYTERGPQGGCYLHDEYRNTLTQLTKDEIAALFVSSIQEPLKDLGLSTPFRGAMLKLAAALPESRQSTGNRVTERVLIESSAGATSPDAVDRLSILHEASMNDQWARVTFQRPFDVQTTRRIAPYGLVARDGRWYVVWAGEDGHHRVDTVASVWEAELEARTFKRAIAFSLQAFWTSWNERQMTVEPHLEVRILVREDATRYVKDELGAREGVFYGVPEFSENWVPMTVRFFFLEEARRALLALGGAVEVIAPEALRRSIQDFAEQIMKLYIE